MKSLVFDSGPIISLATNNLLWLLEELKKRYKGGFYLCDATKREVIDKPLYTKRFKFEALQVLRNMNRGILKVVDNEKLKKKTIELLDLANNSFTAKGHYIRIVHYADISGLVACLYLNSDAYVIDERTTRVLVENPLGLKKILQNKLHTRVDMNKKNVDKFRAQVKNIKLIRSVELVTVAYELGLLDKYILDIENSKKTLLDGVLWGVKLNGCAVSDREIDEILRLESKL